MLSQHQYKGVSPAVPRETVEGGGEGPGRLRVGRGGDARPRVRQAQGPPRPGSATPVPSFALFSSFPGGKKMISVTAFSLIRVRMLKQGFLCFSPVPGSWELGCFDHVTRGSGLAAPRRSVVGACEVRLMRFRGCSPWLCEQRCAVTGETEVFRPVFLLLR